MLFRSKRNSTNTNTMASPTQASTVICNGCLHPSTDYATKRWNERSVILVHRFAPSVGELSIDLKETPVAQLKTCLHLKCKMYLFVQALRYSFLSQQGITSVDATTRALWGWVCDQSEKDRLVLWHLIAALASKGKEAGAKAMLESLKSTSSLAAEWKKTKRDLSKCKTRPCSVCTALGKFMSDKNEDMLLSKRSPHCSCYVCST